MAIPGDRWPKTVIRTSEAEEWTAACVECEQNLREAFGLRKQEQIERVAFKKHGL